MAYSLNKKLIEAVSEHIAKGDNVANVLTNVLSISKESVYKRLKGETLFTLEEAIKIALELNISLDNVICTKTDEQAVFYLHAINTTDFMKDYHGIIDSYIKDFNSVSSYENSKLMLACNTIPFIFYLGHEQLAKFYLYKCIYQKNTKSKFPLYADVVVPPEILWKQKELLGWLYHIKETTCILDRKIFTSFLKEVRYFYKLGLITCEETKDIQRDLNELLKELKMISISGKFQTGGIVRLYLSNIHIDSSYTYIDCDKKQFCGFNLCANDLNTRNSAVCELQERLFKSLLGSSTLITQSNEEEQSLKYFRNQREQVINMKLGEKSRYEDSVFSYHKRALMKEWMLVKKITCMRKGQEL